MHPFAGSHERLTAACARLVTLWHQIATACLSHCLTPACWLFIHMARREAAEENGVELRVHIVTCQFIDVRVLLCRTIEIQDRSRLIDYELFSLYAMALLLLAGAGECCAAAAACACLPGVPSHGVCKAFLLLPHRMAVLLLAAQLCTYSNCCRLPPVGSHKAADLHKCLQSAAVRPVPSSLLMLTHHDDISVSPERIRPSA